MFALAEVNYSIFLKVMIFLFIIQFQQNENKLGLTEAIYYQIDLILKFNHNSYQKEYT